MAMPSPVDYQGAIQTPALCFEDPELRAGQCVADHFGLPRAIAGNFAVVFPMRCARRMWAVRCFSTFHHDQAQRYSAISSCLRQNRLPYMVGFDFVARGIKVASRWFPILKMEWVEGETLSRYVEKHLGDPRALGALAEQFAVVSGGMRRHSIAHGDLQHANILVTGSGRLRLIDYDGMYVPELKGLGSHELGHRNYQHPLRTERDFGPHLDNFSAWVIYLSLIALAIEPSLWKSVGAGDEFLLLCSQDYKHPQASPALGALKQIPDVRLKSLTAQFESLLRKNLPQIPSLDSAFTIRSDASLSPVAAVAPDWLSDHVPAPSRSAQAPASTPKGLSWLVDHLAVKLAPAGTMPVGATPKPLAPPDWVLDALNQKPAKSISVDPTVERASLAVAALTVLGLLLGVVRGSLSPLLLAGAVTVAVSVLVLIFTMRYLALPDVRAKLALTTKMYAARREVRRLRAMGERADRERRRLIKTQAEELAKALREFQAHQRAADLARYQVASTNIPGIGPTLKVRLLSAGVRSALDVDYWRVRAIPGIGQIKAATLQSWRLDCELRTGLNTPQALLPADELRIRQKYEVRLQLLAQEEGVRQKELSARELQLRSAQRDLKEYELITFASYLRQIVPRRRTPGGPPTSP